MSCYEIHVETAEAAALRVAALGRSRNEPSRFVGGHRLEADLPGPIGGGLGLGLLTGEGDGDLVAPEGLQLLRPASIEAQLGP